MSRSCLLVERICESCSTDTSVEKNTGHKNWHFHDGYWLCNSCYHTYVYQPTQSVRQVRFKDKRVYVEENPRTQECSKCGKKVGDSYINYYGQLAVIKKSDMHHIEYHEDDPLKDTKELCFSCHMKETWRIRRMSK